MSPRSLFSFALVLSLCIAAPACAQSPNGAPNASSPETPTLQFGGVTYVHRWSQDGQHEFTPEGQDDLEAWTDMVTLNVHGTVHDGDQLAEVANQVLANYEGAGQILRTNSLPRTDTEPAQHFIAAALGNPAFLEAAFARLMLVEGTGLVVVYSHRIYGDAVGPAMSTWLSENGQQAEAMMMAWDGASSTLRVLPEN